MMSREVEGVNSRPDRRLLALGAGGVAVALAGGAAAWALSRVNRIPSYDAAELRWLRESTTNPLFDSFPALAERIPWRPLGRFPTPVEELPAGDAAGSGARLFVKRDDLSSAAYGGNKVRKLEYLLADAELGGRRTLVTLGGIGSNHALATAIHGAALGLESDLVLYGQPITQHVKRNLAAFLAANARVHYGGSVPGAFAAAGRLVARRRHEGRAPYFVMVGGSSRLGCIGHVSAAFELAAQVAAGELPEPDRLFVPLGTCGTAAGLVIGLRLAGLRTRVCAVRVADPFPASAATVRWMAQDLADFLHRADPAVPRLQITTADFEVLTGYLGTGYGFPTRDGEVAVRRLGNRLTLETTYTAKTLAACLDCCAGHGREQKLLFWNTFSSAPLASAAPGQEAELPPPLRELLDAPVPA